MAKTASDINKPNGQFVIKPSQAEAFVEILPIHKFYGIGKVTANKFKKIGVENGKDLKALSLDFLVKNFGKLGHYYFDISRGIDHRKVEPNRESKSISVENTFSKDLELPSEVYNELFKLSKDLMKRTQKYNLSGKTLTIKIKYSDFESISRSKTIETGFQKLETIEKTMENLIENILPFPKGIRLLGLGLSNFYIEKEEKQLRIEFD